MCGLVGVAGNLSYNDVKNFKTLLYISVSRGKDSTGVAAIELETSKRSETIYVEKDTIPSYDFLEIEESKRYSPIFDKFTNDCLIGHVRWATVGGVNVDNAHPFENKKFVGAHNGTLLNPEYNQSGITDSELMMLDMAEKGLIETLEGLSPKSAYAVTMYEKETGKIHFARNGLRSLWVGIHQTRDVLYWASEQRFLEFLEEDLDIYYFSPYMVYSCDILSIAKKNEAPWTITQLTDKSKEADPYEKVRTFHGHWANDLSYQGGYYDSTDWNEYYQSGQSQFSGGKKESSTASKAKKTDAPKEEILDNWDDFDEQFGVDRPDSPLFTDLVEQLQVNERRRNPDTIVPFEITCAACDEEIETQSDIDRARTYFDNTLIYLCDHCKTMTKNLADDQDNEVRK